MARLKAVLNPRSARGREEIVVTLGVACALLVASLLVAYGGVTDPRLFGVAGALVCLPFAAYAAYAWPVGALTVSFALVLIAGTKFRLRDANATLEGAVDWQVKFELTVYAVLACMLILISLRRPWVFLGCCPRRRYF